MYNMQDLSMFRYLTNDVPKSQTDLELLGEYAKHAASSYLGSAGIPLNESITKTAQMNSLSPSQISILCQEANKEVHSALFDRGTSKYTDFNLANPSQVMAELGHTKTANTRVSDSDYHLSPSEHRQAPDFIYGGASGHNGMRDNSKLTKQASLEKLAQESKQLFRDKILLEDHMEYCEKNFVKVARNHLTQFRIDERRAEYPYLAKFMKIAGLDQPDISHLMDLLDHVMVRQGLLEKTADITADASLVDWDMDARVINGSHPLEMTIKTIVDNKNKHKLIEDRQNIIKDNIEACGQPADGAILGTRGVRYL